MASFQPLRLRPLVYYVALGARFSEFVEASIYSLRHRGQYGGEIVVLTDQMRPDRERTRYVNARAIYPFMQAPRTVRCCQNHKTVISDFVDLTPYSQLVYIDADVLATQAGFSNVLVNAAATKAAVCVQENNFPVANRKPYCGSEIFTEAEIAAYATVAINSGVLIFNLRDGGREVLKAWRDNCVAKQFTSDDQGELTALLCRRFGSRFLYLSQEIARFGTSADRPYSARLAHFFGGRKHDSFYQYFAKYIQGPVACRL